MCKNFIKMGNGCRRRPGLCDPYREKRDARLAGDHPKANDNGSIAKKESDLGATPLQAEVCIASEALGRDIWVVPAYTGQDRQEITPDHLGQLSQILDVFPGSRVVELKDPPKDSDGFKNEYLSYSRLAKFEQCPLAFKLQYIDKHKSQPGMPLKFGSAIHAVLETLGREHMERDPPTPMLVDRAHELWREEWKRSEMSGSEAFGEGLEILEGWVRSNLDLRGEDILAVELEFEVDFHGFAVKGFIDRVDRVDDTTVEIIDYTTNRQLYARYELDDALQLSVYEIAVRTLYPWVTTVNLTYDMLRHGVQQRTSRTSEQLTAAYQYVVTLGEQTESVAEYRAQLNPLCPWCDQKSHCDAYVDALNGERGVVCVNFEDLEAVAVELQEVAALEKMAKSRKGELEKIIKAHLKNEPELNLAGKCYSLAKRPSYTYSLADVLEIMAKHFPDLEGVESAVTTVGSTKLKALVKKHAASSAAAGLIDTELKAAASVRHTSYLRAGRIK
jgi:RecB family exonuclease